MTTNLQKWQEMYGNDDLAASSRKAPTSAPREKLERITLDQLGVAYPVETTAAKVVVSTKGDVQLQLSNAVHVHDHAGDVAGGTTEWITLPFQDSDMTMDKDTVRKLTLRRRDDLVRILSAAIPSKFALYASKAGEGKDAVYTGFNGQPMTKEQLNAREVEINKGALVFAEELHTRAGEFVDELKGAKFFIVKAENPRNAKYPYTNLYSQRPSKLPVFEG